METSIARPNRLWPPVVTDVESSVVYMKRLTVAVVSHVLYLRQYFGDDADRCFEERSLEYLRLKILVDDCQQTDGCRCVVCRLMIFLEAIDHKNLEQLVVCFNTGDDQSAEESYELFYAYDTNHFNISLNKDKIEDKDDDQELSVMGEEIRVLDIRQSIEQMLRSLKIKCQNLSPLPKDIELGFRYDTYDNSLLRRTKRDKTSVRLSNVLSVGIDGHNDEDSSTNKELMPYIKKKAKLEPKC